MGSTWWWGTSKVIWQGVWIEGGIQLKTFLQLIYYQLKEDFRSTFNSNWCQPGDLENASKRLDIFHESMSSKGTEILFHCQLSPSALELLCKTHICLRSERLDIFVDHWPVPGSVCLGVVPKHRSPLDVEQKVCPSEKRLFVKCHSLHSCWRWLPFNLEISRFFVLLKLFAFNQFLDSGIQISQHLSCLRSDNLGSKNNLFQINYTLTI